MFSFISYNRRGRVGAAVAVAVVIALTGCGTGAETGAQEVQEATAQQTGGQAQENLAERRPTSADAPSFVVSGGEVEGPGQVTATVDEEVVFTVSSDTADEVHVHGYDATVPVTPGKPATVRFQADIPGVFEVELEDSGLLLTQLRITQ